MLFFEIGREAGGEWREGFFVSYGRFRVFFRYGEGVVRVVVEVVSLEFWVEVRFGDLYLGVIRVCGFKVIGLDAMIWVGR